MAQFVCSGEVYPHSSQSTSVQMRILTTILSRIPASLFSAEGMLSDSFLLDGRQVAGELKKGLAPINTDA
jgi:hypothetical protein